MNPPRFSETEVGTAIVGFAKFLSRKCGMVLSGHFYSHVNNIGDFYTVLIEREHGWQQVIELCGNWMITPSISAVIRIKLAHQ